MRSHAMTPKIHVSRLRHALMKLLQATAASTDPYVLDAHKTAREVLESLNGTQQTLAPIYKSDDLSPTGRRPSQPELQHLPRPYQLPAVEMTEERAKELLQQYRDTFPAMGARWEASLRNFPCVAVDLASGVDYSVEQHPIQADHASVDDKGNVTWSGIRRGVFSSKGPSQNLPKWKPAEELIQHRLTQTWTISHGTTTISYAPNSAVDIPVLVVSELLDNGVVEVVESCQGEAAVKRARYYLENFELRMKR